MSHENLSPLTITVYNMSEKKNLEEFDQQPTGTAGWDILMAYALVTCVHVCLYLFVLRVLDDHYNCKRYGALLINQSQSKYLWCKLKKKVTRSVKYIKVDNRILLHNSVETSSLQRYHQRFIYL